jgi:signal transduction histidine kinase
MHHPRIAQHSIEAVPSEQAHRSPSRQPRPAGSGFWIALRPDTRWPARSRQVLPGWRTMRQIRCVLICIFASLVPADLAAQEARPRSILVLDDASARSPFYDAVFSSIRTIVNAEARSPVNLYTDSLDLTRFGGADYERGLQHILEVKYRDRPIGVIVTIGPNALDYVLRRRSALWPAVPVAFALVDEPTAASLNRPADVTGYVMKLRLADMMTAARAIVPDLRTVVFVGDPLEEHAVFRHWKDEIPAVTEGVETIDLSGLRMRELRQRVAGLPDHSAILYTGIHSDGEGQLYDSAYALSLVAETANRPIVVTSENQIGRGGVGGFVITPALLGESVARLAMRIIDGESAANIPVSVANIVRPIFDWRQMQSWNVDEAGLPPGSEFRFREPSAWDQYKSQIVAILIVILLQAILIMGLLRERGGRRRAEIETRRRMAELAHMNRYATAGEMSASIAHELTQPLTAILMNAQTAELIIDSPSPNLQQIKEILADVQRDDERAGKVVWRLRGLLKKGPFEPREIDLGRTVSEVFDFMLILAKARSINLSCIPAPKLLQVRGDRIQLQQVILNLIWNAMDALSGKPAGQRRITGKIRQTEDSAEVSVSDSGPGIPSDRLEQIFEPFFTTKNQGMGMGLSIVRSIVEAHGGRIWAENRINGGAVFRVSLPLVQAE